MKYVFKFPNCKFLLSLGNLRTFRSHHKNKFDEYLKKKLFFHLSTNYFWEFR